MNSLISNDAVNKGSIRVSRVGLGVPAEPLVDCSPPRASFAATSRSESQCMKNRASAFAQRLRRDESAAAGRFRRDRSRSILEARAIPFLTRMGNPAGLAALALFLCVNTTAAGLAKFNASSWLAHSEISDLHPGETKIVELHWTNTLDRAVTLRDPHSTSDHFEVLESPGTVKAGSVGQLRVRIEPPGEGPLNAAILADSAGRTGERFVFTFAGTIRSAEWPSPFDEVRVGGNEAWLSAAQLRQRQEGSVETTLVDIRPAMEFQECAIPGALNLRPVELKVRPALKNRPIILVSRGHDEARWLQERTHLLEAGFRDVRVLQGGMNAWIRQGHPTTGSNGGRRAFSISAREVVALRPLTGWVLEGECGSGALKDFLGVGAVISPSAAPDAQRVLRMASPERSLPAQEAANGDSPLVVFELSDSVEECLRQFLFQIAQSQRRSVTQETFDMSSYIQTFRSSRGTGSCCGR